MGDVIDVELHADLVDVDYVWRWNTVITQAGKDGIERANFRQSSFLGTPLSPEGLRKRASNYQPSLTDEGRVTYAILGLMNEGIELREIASRIVERFPDQFATQIEALTRIANLSQKYSR